MRKTIVFMMGATCAGKSTFLEYAKKTLGNRLHTVEVGKALRAKYGADYFKGQAAPTKTAKEAWDICCEEVEIGLKNNDVELILVDGQPRDIKQAYQCVDSWEDIYKRFIFLDVSLEERTRRATKRFDPEDHASLALARTRLEGDLINYCKVFTVLLNKKVNIEIIEEDYDKDALIDGLMGWDL